jgi:hypothetical protein
VVEVVVTWVGAWVGVGSYVVVVVECLVHLEVGLGSQAARAGRVVG